MLALQEKQVEPGVGYDSLEMAEQVLRDAGFYPFHAGLWRSKQNPGVSRDIRKQAHGFVIYEWAYVSK